MLLLSMFCTFVFPTRVFAASHLEPDEIECDCGGTYRIVDRRFVPIGTSSHLHTNGESGHNTPGYSCQIDMYGVHADGLCDSCGDEVTNMYVYQIDVHRDAGCSLYDEEINDIYSY